MTLVFPGPDAHIRQVEHGDAGAAPGAAPPTRTPNPGDIGRRVAVERHRQRLSRGETARRARMSPDYLAYLEEQPADPTVATLIRLADALGTTVADLRGSGIDLPPVKAMRCCTLSCGTSARMNAAPCSPHGVGRIAVSASDGRPAVVPVNYEVVDDAILFRTAPGSAPAAAAGKEVAFEVDHVDDALSQGWSVLAVGPASVVTEPDAVRRLTQDAHTRPWPGGAREMWVSIRPASLTGGASSRRPVSGAGMRPAPRAHPSPSEE